MGFFSFFDARRQLAKGVNRLVRRIQGGDPQLPLREVLERALIFHLTVNKPKRDEATILSAGLYRVIDVFSLCHLLADAELLAHFRFEERLEGAMQGKDVVTRTRRVIDDELGRLGWKPLSGKVHAMVSLHYSNPTAATQLYGGDPDFRWAMDQRVSTATFTLAGN